MEDGPNKYQRAPWVIESGWLNVARACPSPNYNERPESEISLLVIHNISLPPGEFSNGCIEKLFTNQLDTSLHPYFEQLKELEVSAHLLITRDGEIVQFVAFDKRAWHAGLSRFEGRDNCNDFSIGIELEGTDDLPYTEMQYKHLIQVSQLLIKSYPQLNTDRVTGHQHIAPGRKTDPGHYFDWDYFRAALVKDSI